jgi:hypothetical protein
VSASDNPSGLLEEQEAESTMVTATVDVGEVIPVENTPPQPPPLPEPPPFTICFDPRIDYYNIDIIGNYFDCRIDFKTDPNRWFHSVTSIDGEFILMIQVLLFQSMYQVQGFDDDDDDDDDADIIPVRVPRDEVMKCDDDTITASTAIPQVVVLYQHVHDE